MRNKLKTGLLLFICTSFLCATAFAEVSIVPSDTIPLKPFQVLKEVLEKKDNKMPEKEGVAGTKDNGTAPRPDNKTGKPDSDLKKEFERFNKGN